MKSENQDQQSKPSSKHETNWISLLVIAIIVLVIVVALVSWMHSRSVESESSSDASGTEPLIGGDRDEHGCIGSAGYTWCEPKQKCLRTWEEECD